MTKLKALFLFLFTVFCSQAAVAHHGNFTYDGDTIMTLQGEVITFNYTNPHGSIVLRTEGNSEVEIEIDGRDEDLALSAIEEIINDKLSEED